MISAQRFVDQLGHGVNFNFRNRRVGIVHRRTQRGRNRRWIRRSTNLKIGRPLRPERIEERIVDSRTCLFPQAVVFRIGHHSHHFGAGWIAGISVGDVLADGIGVWEVAFGESLIDHRRARTVAAILRQNSPSSQNRHSHYREIIGPDLVHARIQQFARLGSKSFHRDGIAGFGVGEQPIS